jgi:hypothetical protein
MGLLDSDDEGGASGSENGGSDAHPRRVKKLKEQLEMMHVKRELLDYVRKQVEAVIPQHKIDPYEQAFRQDMNNHVIGGIGFDRRRKGYYKHRGFYPRRRYANYKGETYGRGDGTHGTYEQGEGREDDSRRRRRMDDADDDNERGVGLSAHAKKLLRKSARIPVADIELMEKVRLEPETGRAYKLGDDGSH